ncbi:MAG TPA: pyruvate dehydrogenase complex dihydrolipoamide acetyltransferase [Gemmatimonadaceae bacterium]|nr:pyruvate dehydrogenase complex dihydrolipoamide acetyltransferase [Gemmatimonadaceae bacterium]
MATKVTMEALSPTMEEGRLVKWTKNEGDQVKAGDVLAEVETDKAVMELVARGDGVLRKRLANEGDASPIGTLLAVIAAPDENIDSIVGSAAPAAAAATPAQPAPVAQAQSPTQSQGEGSAPPPQKAAAGPSVTPPAPAQPRPVPPRPPAAPAAPRGNGSTQPGAPSAPGGRQRSSPLARRLASEKGIQLGAIHGTGPGGRIVKRDIENAKATGGSGRSAAAERLATEGDFKDVPLTQIRKTIARRLSESNGPIPTFFLTAEYDATRAAELRTQLVEMGDQYKVSFNDIVIKAVALALAEHPEVNAHWLTDKIRHFNRIHVAMAVAVEDGLITPVLFDADRMTLWEISEKARELAKKARERKLMPEEYTGATFTVSNLGMFGIDQFTAIINPPEVGILAIGGVEEKPVVIDGSLEVRQRMRVTMSCDHRVVDGATGAKFLQTVRRYIENPLSLII